MPHRALPQEFDYNSYIEFLRPHAQFFFIWKPPGQSQPRLERHLPVRLSKKSRQSLEKIQEWAERTDPKNKIRMEHWRQEWAGRAPGQDVVSPFWHK